MKTISLVTSAILAASMGLTAQESVCSPWEVGSTLTTSSNRSWFFDLSVTSSNGITVSSFDVHADAGSEWQVYFRAGGYSGHTSNQGSWTLLGNYVTPTNLPITAYLPLDIADRHFDSGTYGIALVRVSSGSQTTPYTTSFAGDSGPGASISGGQVRSGIFSGTLRSRMVGVCVRYHVGPYGRFNMSTEAPNGPLLTTPLWASPADVYGETGGQGSSSLFYPFDSTVTFTAPGTTNSNGLLFDHWKVDGVEQTLFQRSISRTSGGNQNLTATYDHPRIVTLQANCDGNAAVTSVTSSPADRFGTSIAMSGDTLEFRRLTEVTFSAAPLLGDCVFTQWRVDGVVVPSADGLLTTTIAADTTIVAEYGQPSSCFEGDIGPALGMGDDTLSTNHALGFDFPLPGGGTTNAIDISSNGFVWLQAGSSSDTGQAAVLPQLWQNPPRICALWSNLIMPTSGSDVHFHALPGRAVITWKNVSILNRPQMFTVQCTMFPNGRVQFAHIGEIPAVAWITAVVAGNTAINQPGPLNIATQSSWSNTFDAGWFWQPLPNPNPHGSRVFTSAPIEGGFAGADLSNLCAPSVAMAYGSGCASDVPASFYQLGDGSDLASTSYRMTPNAAGGYDVDVSATNLFESAIGTNRDLNDDDLETVDLPFSFAYPTNPIGTSSIDVCSNGFLWLEAGSTSNTAFQANVTSFFDLPTRLAPFWVDLNPADPLSDGVYVNVLSNRVVITWNDCVRYNGTTPLTAQCILWADGSVTLSYGSSTAVTLLQVLTGWSPGYGATAVEAIQLSTDVPFATAAPSNPIALDVAPGSVPALGQTVALEASNLSSAVTAGALFLGVAQQQLDLGVIGADGCTLLTSVEASMPFGITGSIATVNLDIPADPALIGDTYYTQVAVIEPGANALGVTTSNGLTLTVGDF